MASIYVVGAARGPKKIGISEEPGFRVRGLQTGNSGKLSVLFVAPAPDETIRRIERHAHWLLDEHRAHGEWFNVSLTDAKTAVEAAVANNGSGQQARSSVGRPKVNHEQMPARFPAGTFERIDAVRGDETRTAFVQQAVEAEIKRRERKSRQASKPS